MLNQGHLRFSFISFLLHDIKDHATCFRAPLRRGMDGDGLFSSASVLLPMDVNPTVKQPAERSPLRCVWCHIKAFESSGAELATHRKAHFNTCTSSGVNLGLADIHLPSPGPMQAQAVFCFCWFRSVLSYIHLRDLRSGWELRDVSQRQKMHQEGARTNPQLDKALRNLVHHL